MKHKFNYLLLVVAFLGVALVSSCQKDSTGQIERIPHKQNEPIVVDDFYPKSGGAAEKIIFEGSNFGDDPSELRIWFNDKPGAVIGTSGNRMYAIAPKRPGEGDTIPCIIKIAYGDGVKSGFDSISVPQEFEYRVSRVVSTIASKPGGDTNSANLVFDGTLAEAVYGRVNALAIDLQDNVFVYSSYPSPMGFIQINETENRSRLVYKSGASGEPAWVQYGQPALDMTTGQMALPSQGQNEGRLVGAYFEFDPLTQWMPVIRNIIHPREDQLAAGMQDWAITSKSAMCFDSEGNVWTMDNPTGTIIKADRRTRIGEAVQVRNATTGELGYTTGVTETNAANEGTHMLFHPNEPTHLYISYYWKGTIYIYHTDTHEFELYAGRAGSTGYRDGDRLTDAQFDGPAQFLFEADGTMMIADTFNHVIRQITPDHVDPETGELVRGVASTMIGWPGQSGYEDGTPENAKFNNPMGLAVSPVTGDIYVTDFTNTCVRKIAIQ